MRFPFVAIIAVLTACLSPTLVLAQADNKGFALDKFEPAERGSDWFSLDSLDLRGDARTAVGLTADYARKPLVFRDAEGAEKALVESQLLMHAAMSIAFHDRLRLGLNIPFAPLVTGSEGRAGGRTFQVEEGPAMGDIRVSADVRLFGDYGEPVSVALGAAVWFPTGNYRAFTGDGKARVGPRVAVAGVRKRFHYALRVAYNHRPRDSEFAGIQLGSELAYGAGVGVRIGKSLLLGPELSGSKIVAGGSGKLGHALEAIVGLHYTVAETVRLGVGAGPGLSEGLGSPEVRALVSVGWMSRDRSERREVDTKSDRDRDRVPDYIDGCPDEKGAASANPPGCPLADGDGDGIGDNIDSCPFVAGVRSADSALHGCPSQDRDEDGVLDGDDACPDKPGRATAERRTSGCADSDGDSVFDPVDACPREAGVANLDPAKTGCPVLGTPAPVEPPAAAASASVTLDERVMFHKGKPDMLPGGRDVLERVGKLLVEHPEITLVSVEGHTDSGEREDPHRSMRLSKKRVSAVLAALTQAGVDSARLIGHGFGAERPEAPNVTEAGREQNRRVQLHILEIDHRPVGGASKE